MFDLSLWLPSLAAGLVLAPIPEASAPLGAGHCTASRGIPSTSNERFVDVAAALGAPVIVVATSTGTVVVLDSKEGGERARHVAGAAVWAVDIDIRGELVAVLHRSGRLVLWRWAEGERVEVTPVVPAAPDDGDDRLTTDHGYRFGQALSFSPTGERLLVGAHGRGVQLLARDGRTVATIQDIRSSWFGPEFAWDKEGTRLAYPCEGGFRVLDAGTGAPAKPAAAAEAEGGEAGLYTSVSPVECLSFHPSGAHIATGHVDGRIRIHALATRAETACLEHVDPMWGAPPKQPVQDDFFEFPSIGRVAHSHDGTRLAYTTVPGVHLGCFDLAARTRIGIGPFAGGRMGEPAEIVWAPDDRRLWYALISGGMPLYWMQFESGKRYGDQGLRGTAPTFGHGARGVLVSGGETRALDGATGKLLWAVDTKLERLSAPAAEAKPPGDGR